VNEFEQGLPVQGPEPQETQGLLLIGEGLSSMTPERLQMLGEMVGELGLRVTVSHEGLASPIETQDPHVIAQEISEASRAHTTLNAVINPGGDIFDTNEETTALRVLRTAWWRGVTVRATHEPIRMGEVAHCLAARPDKQDRNLSLHVAKAVFDTYINRGSLEAAWDIAGVWRGLKGNRDRELQHDVEDMLEHAINDLDERVSAGRSELHPLLMALWETQGHLTSISNEPDQ
jgi:hypothetical protein